MAHQHEDPVRASAEQRRRGAAPRRGTTSRVTDTDAATTDHLDARDAMAPDAAPTYERAVEDALAQGSLLDRLSDSLSDHVAAQLQVAGASARERQRVERLRDEVEGQRNHLDVTLEQLDGQQLEDGATGALPKVEGIDGLAHALEDLATERALHLHRTARTATLTESGTGAEIQAEERQVTTGGSTDTDRTRAAPGRIHPSRPFTAVVSEHLATAASATDEIQQLEAHRDAVEARHREEQEAVRARQAEAEQRARVAAEHREAERQASLQAAREAQDKALARTVGARPLSLTWATRVLADTDLGWAEDRHRARPPLDHVRGDLELRSRTAADHGEQQLRRLGDELTRDQRLPLAAKVLIAAVLLTAGALVLGATIMSGVTALLLAALFLRRAGTGPSGSGGGEDGEDGEDGEVDDTPPDAADDADGTPRDDAGPTAPDTDNAGTENDPARHTTAATGTEPPGTVAARTQPPGTAAAPTDPIGSTIGSTPGSGWPRDGSGIDTPPLTAAATLLALAGRDLVAAGSALPLAVPTARVDPVAGTRSPHREHAVAAAVCALANSGGGVLVIGVDDQGRPSGLGADLATVTPPELAELVRWLPRHLDDHLRPAPTVGIDGSGSDGQELLVVEVPAAPAPVRCRAVRPEYDGDGDRERDQDHDGHDPATLWVRDEEGVRALDEEQAAAHINRTWPDHP